MTRIREGRPILAVDPTHDGVAFVFLEHGTPVDWGTPRDDGNEIEVLDNLIADYAPQVIVLENPDSSGCERRARMRRLLRQFGAHAESLGLVVIKIGRAEVRGAWRARGATRKQAVAVRIADIFPDLKPLVPRPRHHSREVPRERLFGALALVLHAFETADETGNGAIWERGREAS